MLEKLAKPPQVVRGGISLLEQYAIVPFVAQAEPFAPVRPFDPEELAQQYGKRLLGFLFPLLHELHASVDRRPLRTFFYALESMVSFQVRTFVLLLTLWVFSLKGLGWGGGTKRLGTLIRH